MRPRGYHTRDHLRAGTVLTPFFALASTLPVYLLYLTGTTEAARIRE